MLILPTLSLSLLPVSTGTPINIDPQLFLQDQVSKDKAFQTMATMSSAQLISAPSLQAKLGPAGPQVAWIGDCGVQGWRVGGVWFQLGTNWLSPFVLSPGL